MIESILNLFGYKYVYVCEWGTYSHRYDTVDYMSMRPVHKNMSVAPPWAKGKVVAINFEPSNNSTLKKESQMTETSKSSTNYYAQYLNIIGRFMLDNNLTIDEFESGAWDTALAVYLRNVGIDSIDKELNASVINVARSRMIKQG